MNLPALAGSGSDTITVPNGYMMQAQLEQPGNADIDYDLYIFDDNDNMEDASENVTYVVNGKTLVEDVAVINETGTDLEYKILVNSFIGGSETEAYTLTYALTDVYDEYETDEQPQRAGEFVFSGSSDSISGRNISSPIDSDWYMFTVPSGYDEMQLNISSSSTNVQTVLAYRNIATDSTYQMAPVSLSNGKNAVLAGDVYYLKVCYGGSLNGFDQNSIESYTLSVSFSVKSLEPGSISITGFEGGTYVTYGYGKLYRVTGNRLTVKGVVKDTEGKALANAPVLVAFANPAWDGDSRYGLVTQEGITDASGRFTLTITLPPKAGLECYYVNPSTHYYDTCTVIATPGNDVFDTDYVYQYAYSAYGDNT
ncbi:MAG: DUF4198 domain-containing protein [Lachnospiraceae bacterium]|nr:DUF4198 domain-containing protein [Lachnospiraceae bacterium]